MPAIGAMSEIRFYHLQRTRLGDALPVMLERSLKRGQRAVVVAPTPERLDALDARLWEYDPAAFLPHGTAADGFAGDQPIFLTSTPENPNGASVLFLCDGAGAPGTELGGFALVALLFDGGEPAMVEQARLCWSAWKSAGHSLAYWQQTDTGWVEKARG